MSCFEAKQLRVRERVKQRVRAKVEKGERQREVAMLRAAERISRRPCAHAVEP